ncbi:phosphatidic acid phosphatase type 2/haloperoxidase [Scheffersomyces coipomensis]|uniref:phosphatidic acid phosphatase type 2/haloperoxidase n=1 Tax=Scheffersomyces coipomensis TaxID=1788519 RepID=UPI00315DEA22
MKLYFSSDKFKKFIPDWITIVVLIIIFFNVLETAPPFTRQFSINDSRISHPFAKQERFTDNELYLWSLIVPSILVSLISSFFDKLHLLQVSNVGLWFSVVFAAVLTDILKCWIGNPRPDFLSRCGPKASTPIDVLVDIDCCTSPLGPMYLMDGMKSTPSGHSSMSFAGLLYLSFWLFGQFKVLSKGATPHKFISNLYLYLAFSLPVLFASYIALSRTQDYRHHFFDVGFGSLIGIVMAYFSYFKYFNALFDVNSHLPIDY